MNKLWRTLLVLGSLVLMAVMPTLAGAGCVDGTGNLAKDGGLGGTGDLAKDGGIGGTGDLAKDGGIGGTGNPAKDGGIGGTGIIGTITGFASICVNGLEVHYDGATQVSINGTTVDTTMLAVGQVVALYAENSPKGLHARSVAVLHALEGPVTDISQEEHGIVLVMGRTVRMTDDTKLDGLIKLGDLRPGNMVRVSGYKNAQGEVVATRLQLAPGESEASVIGLVSSDRRDHFALDGLPVSNVAVALEFGGEAMVRGTWNGKELIAREIVREPSLPFAGRVERVVAEGLIVGAVAQRLNISGFAVDIGDATEVSGGNRDELVAGQKVRITGKLEEGRHLKAERVELVRRGNGIDSKGSSRQPTQKQLPMRPDASPAGDMKSGEHNPSMEMSIGERGNRIERIERIDKTERMDRMERVEPPVRMERMEPPVRIERLEPPVRLERLESPSTMGHGRPCGK